MLTSLRSAAPYDGAVGFVLNETVHKLTPDGPFNGSFMDNFEFIFLAFCPLKDFSKTFFYVISV